jgi:2-enoate reductase
LSGHCIEKITALGVRVKTPDGNNAELKADKVIAAFGMRSNKGLTERIWNKYYDATIIGDCGRVAQIVI